MPTTKSPTKKPAAKPSPARGAAKAAPKKPAKAPPARMTLDEAMRTLERAGSEQTRKTYTRHGATGPMFGVSFATLKELKKRIGVDHELAEALWATGNLDARNLAVKIVDPARLTPDDLDRWVSDASGARFCGGYGAMLAAEGPHGAAKAKEWLASDDETVRCGGWTLLGQMAMRDETLPDDWYLGRLAEIERRIHSAPNSERGPMNMAIVWIGCRNAALRKAALASAKRIGNVDVDHGDTSCKTPDAAQYIEKTWAHAKAKGFETPAAQERLRDVPRLRC
jgi:3-methyladenine DNA glycosylase AlkD